MYAVFIAVAGVPLQKTFIQPEHMFEQTPLQLQAQRSAMPFCQGLRKLVCFDTMERFFIPLV